MADRDPLKRRPAGPEGWWARQRGIILRSLVRRLILIAALVVFGLVIVAVRFWPWP